jgi:iron complex outermembrane receptor protein
MAKHTNLSKAIRYALAVNAGIVGLSAAPLALAQEGAAVEEVTVTGTRIRRQDFVSNAPVATVGFEQIQLTGTVNTESLLNQLPQIIPGLDRTSNNPGNGTATVDLRGLGANRTLVLVDGIRAVPNNAAGIVDINSIPNSLIERVEVLTGGASAVYGADAVAGVVNFILRDDFEGVDFNIGQQLTQEGDAGIFSADVTLGVNMAGGRGNMVLNIAYTDRDDLFQGDRDFSFFALGEDTSTTPPGLREFGSSGIPGTSIFAGPLGDGPATPPGAGAPCDSFGITFDPNGQARCFVSQGSPNDYYNYAPVNYIQLPQERYQFTTLGHFEINARAEVYARAMFTRSSVPQQLAPTPIFQTSTFTVDQSPFFTPETQQYLSDTLGDGVDTDGDGIDDTATAFVRRRLEEVGPRISDDSFESFQFLTGIRGEISSNWTYDAHLGYGNTNAAAGQRGNVARGRFDQALLLAGTGELDANGDYVIDGDNCQDPSNSGSTVPCSPMNIFGEGNISEDSAAFLRTAVASTADFDQTIIGLTLAGDLGDRIKLPGGRIGVAVGYEYIDNNFEFRPSQDLASGDIAGFNGSPPVGGGFDSNSIYAEAILPIANGVAFAEQLEVELAYRYSDFSTVGQVNAYKVAGSWAPVGAMRFRGGFNRAVRAPNIGELFSPQGEGFPSAEDPCSANGGDQSAQVRAICEATGVPAGNVFSPVLNAPAGQIRGIFGGNPNLQEETADTFTAGIVITPPLDGLTFSVDYFDIQIEDVIAAFGGGVNNILQTCYDPADPNGGDGSLFCDTVNRRTDGTIDFVETLSQNAALQTLKGIDFLASYDTDLWNGNLRVNYVATYTTENDFTAFDGADPIECAGNFGNLCGEPVPAYKHRMTLNYGRDNWNAQLAWRLVGSVDDDDPGTVYAVEQIDAFNYLDFSGQYSFGERFTVTGGVNNLTNKEPPIMGNNQEQANTWPASYDVFGRTFFLRFNTGI